MRILSAIVCLPLVLLPAMASAMDSAFPLSGSPATAAMAPPANLSEPATKERVNDLFLRLKRETDEEAARGIAGEIRSLLLISDSATVDLLMHRATDAIAGNQKAAAFDYLDQVIVLRPDYAEGWNLRATLHFALGNNRKSVSDIGHVLAIEPRHLGALSGLAGILALEGRDEAALKVWETYLAIFPTDRNAQDQARDLLEKLAGSRT